MVDYGFYGAAGCDQGPVPGREAEFTNLFMDDDAKLFRGMMDVAKTGKALEQFGPFAKCNPPVRDPENQKGLWQFCFPGISSRSISLGRCYCIYFTIKKTEVNGIYHGMIKNIKKLLTNSIYRV